MSKRAHHFIRRKKVIEDRSQTKTKVGSHSFIQTRTFSLSTCDSSLIYYMYIVLKQKEKFHATSFFYFSLAIKANNEKKF